MTFLTCPAIGPDAHAPGFLQSFLKKREEVSSLTFTQAQ